MGNDPRREINSVRMWYDQVAQTFSTRYTGIGGEFWRSFEDNLALDLLGCPNRVLDLGCGTGRLSAALAGRGASVLGIDFSMSMIAVARSAAHHEGVSYSVMDATRAALKPASFDAVVSLGMFEYMADPTPFVDEIVRILRPGGRVVFTCHNVVAFPSRIWMFVKAGLKSLRQQPRSNARNEFFQPVAHRAESMLHLLRKRGLVNADYRGFHFPPAVDGFQLATRLPFAPLARIGKVTAVALDRFVGRIRVTRRMSALAMFTAQKPV
jgi:2-polyprenyl-3-methyl-5-hydroxy-6-metoxy-1,4-benzoquinol methylase